MESSPKELVQDSLLFASDDISVKLPVFEGPLDLLLFLIRKNEIDIYDIPIESVTTQYLAVLKSMEKLNLDLAGEFFVMAATLMYIKSRMLLPTDETAVNDDDQDEPSDPRWELVEQLLEYKKVKQAAYELDDLIRARQLCMQRNCYEKDLSDAERPLSTSDRIEIWNTFNLVLRRLAESLVKGEIKDELVTVTDRMEYILKLDKKKFTFGSLFEDSPRSYMYIVSTLIAVLELCRLKKLAISQNKAFDDIDCEVLPDARSLESVLENADKTL